MDYFRFRLRGKVLVAPVSLHRISGARLDAVLLTVAVNLPAFEGGKATQMNVEVEAWGKARPAAEALREGQEVVIVGNVVRRRMLNERGNYATRKDGSAIWLTDFRAQEVLLPAAAPVELQRGKPAVVRSESPAAPAQGEEASEDIPF